MIRLGGNAPLRPQVRAPLRADEGDVWRAVLQDRGREEGVDVVLVDVGRQHGVDLRHGERIEHDGSGAQVRLRRPPARHVPHLVERRHLLGLLGPLAVAEPQVGGDVGAVLGLEPDAGATDPPHAERSGRDLRRVDFLVEPGAPLGESAKNPLLACDVVDLAHGRASFLRHS